MIDGLAAPGMAADISLSTLEPVQQLGARLAQLLGAELSRLRADVAFATSAGMAVDAPAQQHDVLHAQQSSALGRRLLSLNTQSALFPDTQTRFADNAAQSDQERVDDRGCSTSSAVVEEEGQELPFAELAPALSSALHAFQISAIDAGYTGSPLAVVLPASDWLKSHAPANILQNSSESVSAAGHELLILCLAFDGTLGSSRSVLGLLFQSDRWIGSIKANWTLLQSDLPDTYYSAHTQNTHSLLSGVLSMSEVGQAKGLRVKIDSCAAEPAAWSWHGVKWTWH